ncbi:MAG: 2-isopropylmalate synthase [Lachnospiraceae bacterium]|jgi:2-isopropylmalate synthase|nr:2-isopropylmalate synthase [Lachnospiraceae bacterium]MEE3461898.1 2-isopropylmalate synthase [Lachnospiraceae bacterium]
MKGFEKYTRRYFLPPEKCTDWVMKDHIEKAPIWCSVDLRDGNQALIEPMGLEEKIEFYKMLIQAGFKEIEVGFPAASDTEFRFVRELIERDLVPDDVTLQVLTQAREHIIRRTFDAVKGAPNAIVHVYNSTSVQQREQVFRKSKDEIRQLAVDGATLLKELKEQNGGNIRFEYSPESFHNTEVEYAVEVCNAVLDVWDPQPDEKPIINIPSTVETAMPHVFARQIEYVDKHLSHRNNVILSLHPHNDRGCGVACAELGVLAGADRIEGTLFGNGERTGNLDILTVAMNLYAYGVDPELDFSDMQSIADTYEKLTGMKVSPRQPYAGDLVFTAFSGSHQDAIAKGMAYMEEKGTENKKWNVPYLPIDPRDVGRTYDSDVIRINSQSGRGGVNYVLKQNYGINLPDKMRGEVGYLMKGISDREHAELTPENIKKIFDDTYIKNNKFFDISAAHFVQESDGSITAKVTIAHGDGKETTETVEANGNGRLDAVSNAVKQCIGVDYTLTEYSEQALTKKSSSQAMAYVAVADSDSDDKNIWGAGENDDIIKASIDALASAVNRKMGMKEENKEA